MFYCRGTLDPLQMVWYDTDRQIDSETGKETERHADRH